MPGRAGQGRGLSRARPEGIAVRQRRITAMQMRLAGATNSQIAAELGYRRPFDVNTDIQRALVELAAEPAAELRAIEVARLDQTLQRLNEARAIVLEVLAREHLTVSQGRVVEFDGRPLVDDAPVLGAVDRLIAIEAQHIKVQERRAKLLGLDAPTKLAVITDDVIDAEIRALADELDRAAAAQAADAEGATPTES